MKNKTVIIVLVVCNVIIVGAIGFVFIKGDLVLSKTALESLEQDINMNKLELEQDIGMNKLEIGLTKIEEKYLNEAIDLIKISTSVRTDYVFMDFSDIGYSTISSEGIMFLILIDRVENYMDGYNVFLRIGNISSIDFEGLTIYATWGISSESLSDNFYDGIEDDAIEYSITETFEAGYWTVVKIFSEEPTNKAVKITMYPNRVSLPTSKN